MKIRKFKLFFSHEKEEMWLNHLANSGYHLVDKTWFSYLFIKGAPMTYTYRVECLPQPFNSNKSNTYIASLKELGVEVITHQGRWVYMKKETAKGPFNLYSDINTKINYYKEIRRVRLIVLLLNLIVGVQLLNMNVVAFAFNFLRVIFIVGCFSVVILLTISNILLTRKISLLKRSNMLIK
ncbi:DUF2812 domain-containing protein [Liberiplasma polymorphum]|uniref:DUF2812 domain-containing protein n=1 Tax=Liberiplasma polymorphum TaxID=3374570 RepID=UPI003773B0A7